LTPALPPLFAATRLAVVGLLAAFLFGSSPVEARDAQQTSQGPEITDSYSLLGSYLAGRVAHEEKQFEVASEYFRRALARDPDNPDMLDKAFRMELAAGNLERAGALAKRLVQSTDGGNKFAYLLLGSQAFKSEDYARAEVFFGAMGESPIIQLTDTLALAWTQYARGEPSSALETLSVPQRADRSRYFQRLHTALLADLAGRHGLAAENFSLAHETHSTNARLVEAYARHAAARGKTALMKDLLSPYETGEQSAQIMGGLRERLTGTDSPRLLVETPVQGLAEVFFGIGGVLASERIYEVSRIYLRISLMLRPSFPRAHYLLGEMETTEERYEAALDAYQAIDRSSPLFLSAQIRSGLILNAMDRGDEGIGLLSALIDDYPDEPRLHQAIGNILRDQKSYAEAAKFYTRALEIVGKPEAEHWIYYYARGICHERLKQWDKAEADLKKALELNPGQASVMNYLGYSWVDQNMHLDRAMDLIRKAVDLKPNNGYYVDSLGWAYYMLGKYDEAVRHLERAVELRPEDPVLNDHLGDAYWQVGRRREARFQWSHALSLEPEPEDEKESRDKLANGLQEQNRKAELDEADAANVR